MARIDRKRLDAATFPARYEVQTRFDDLDIQGHVNNVSVVVMLQEARVHFNRVAGFWEMGQGLRMVAAGLTVEYAGEMYHPEPVEVFTAPIAIGRSSFTMGQVIRQGDRTTTYAEETMVVADANGPAPIPDAIRARLEELSLVPQS